MVQPFYDPMIAKVITRADDRESARLELQKLCADLIVWPVKTNAPFLVRALGHESFAKGDITTGFIGTYEEALRASENLPEDVAIWAAAEIWIDTALSPSAGPSEPGFRLNRRAEQRVTLSVNGTKLVVDLGRPATELSQPEHFRHDGKIMLACEGMTWEVKPFVERGTGSHHAHDGDIIAPMPGKVIAVDVAEGQAVTAGQRLMVLEAMKMEHALTAPFDGTVTQLSVSAGAQVQVEALLCVVEPAAEG